MTPTLVGKILKGLYSALIALLGSLTTVLQGSATFGQLTDGQWTTIALFTVVAFGGTFGLAGWSGPTNGNAAAKVP